ncbi:MAG: CBS domain-containing protein [Deltaproteobacteria bacterium]|nr:CBS domain-containing protein [Deltaproteobacteria bacterium]
MASNPPHDDDFSEDEGYFESESAAPNRFDASLLRAPTRHLPTRFPLLFSPTHTVTQAMRAMQKEHRGCVLVTEDGSNQTRVVGIFTERDVLLRIVDRGRNPATLPLAEVMTRDPESLPKDASIAWVLNKMSVGGFRHVPVVDRAGRPVCVVSVRDVVEMLVERFPREVLTLPPEYGADFARTREGA